MITKIRLMKTAKILGFISAICSALGPLLIIVYWNQIISLSNYPKEPRFLEIVIFIVFIAMMLSFLAEALKFGVKYIRLSSSIAFAVYVLSTFFVEEPLKGAPGFVFAIIMVALISRMFSYLIAAVTVEKFLPEY